MKWAFGKGKRLSFGILHHSRSGRQRKFKCKDGRGQSRRLSRKQSPIVPVRAIVSLPMLLKKFKG